jgi:hypothetical protein
MKLDETFENEIKKTANGEDGHDIDDPELIFD